MHNMGPNGPSAGSGEENENLRSDLEKLECHFTWGLTAQDVNLNFLEAKFRDVVSLPEDSLPQEINLKGRTYNHLAYVKHLQGCNQEALGYLGKANKENEDNAKSCIVTYGNLAWVHHLMGDDREANTYLRRLESNESFPTPPPAALHREVFGEKAWSLLNFSKNHYQDAKECFYESLQREPDDKELNTGYAFSLFRWDGWRIKNGEKIPLSTSRSVRQLKKAQELDPDNGMIMVYLALVFQNNGKKLVAGNYIKKALEVSPNNFCVVLRVGKFLRKVKNYDMALHALEKMLKIVPDSARLHHEISNNYRWKAIRGNGLQDDRELILRSIPHKEEEVRLNPSYFYPQLELAMRYAEVKDMERAEGMFQEMFARYDLKPADRQALHRMYGDFQKYHMDSMRTAVTHYMEGMRLQNISTDWEKCRTRLLQITESQGTFMHFEIKKFLSSF
ncbi:hypothetical protein SKAU_G00180500 [Synaphobranchus kaupii]|uniref:Uncharacterized protein n=1 Tax=Synaphobranchus kaupii TaxID=118154 RepID=A0A9Q1FM93_SYNKA|nr:hypothetical protein SKAU_G00180500 [Synaphobranchus kaupii]